MTAVAKPGSVLGKTNPISGKYDPGHEKMIILSSEEVKVISHIERGGKNLAMHPEIVMELEEFFKRHDWKKMRTRMNIGSDGECMRVLFQMLDEEYRPAVSHQAGMSIILIAVANAVLDEAKKEIKKQKEATE